MHIPPSAEVHSYKRVIHDRVDDADVKITATGEEGFNLAAIMLLEFGRKHLPDKLSSFWKIR